jgi:uncharacterized membrane protein YheB (UPF0754 family)
LLSAEWLVLPVIGGLIGYVTNVIAIRMLFRPRRPVTIPGTSFCFHGLIPRRHAELARAIGDIVEKDLLPIDRLVDMFDSQEYHEVIAGSIASHVDKRVRTVLPDFIPVAVQDAIAGFVRDAAGREAHEMVAAATEGMRGRLKEDLHVGDLVYEKIMELDLDELEKMVISISKRELRYIEVLGGFLGFLIGIIQAAIVVFWRSGLTG